MIQFLTVSMEGDKALIGRIKSIPSSVRQALVAKITALSLKLEAYVKTQKLSGQVLNRKSGALIRSIQSRVDQTTDWIRGYVFSAGDVKYAAIHEFGGRTAAHIIRPKSANRLFFYWEKVGGTIAPTFVNHPGSQMPERSYLRSSLREMSESISLGMKQALVEGIQRSTSA